MTNEKVVIASSPLLIEDLLKRDMTYEEITIDLYRVTQHDDCLSSDDYRIENYNWNKHTNSIGAYFLWLKKKGYINRLGLAASIIKSNKGREIKTYTWSNKAHKEFK